MSRVAFHRDASGHPCVTVNSVADELLQGFLEAEARVDDEIPELIRSVLRGDQIERQYANEVWWLRVTPDAAVIEFEYEDDPFEIDPAELLTIFESWRAFVRSTP